MKCKKCSDELNHLGKMRTGYEVWKCSSCFRSVSLTPGEVRDLDGDKL